jgi:hypothetical protein
MVTIASNIKNKMLRDVVLDGIKIVMVLILQHTASRSCRNLLTPVLLVR